MLIVALVIVPVHVPLEHIVVVVVHTNVVKAKPMKKVIIQFFITLQMRYFRLILPTAFGGLLLFHD